MYIQFDITVDLLSIIYKCKLLNNLLKIRNEDVKHMCNNVNKMNNAPDVSFKIIVDN